MEFHISQSKQNSTLIHFTLAAHKKPFHIQMQTMVENKKKRRERKWSLHIYLYIGGKIVIKKICFPKNCCLWNENYLLQQQHNVAKAYKHIAMWILLFVLCANGIFILDICSNPKKISHKIWKMLRNLRLNLIFYVWLCAFRFFCACTGHTDFEALARNDGSNHQREIAWQQKLLGSELLAFILFNIQEKHINTEKTYFKDPCCLSYVAWNIIYRHF